MYLPRGRRGISKWAAPVALIVILVVAGGYIFLTRGSPTSTSDGSTVTSPPNVPVRTAVNKLIEDFNGRNVDSLVTLYSQGAVVVWSGKTGGLVGQYTGPGNIRLIYAASVGKTTTMSANLSSYAEEVFSPTHVNATFVLDILGNSTVAGILSANVNISEEWKWGNAGWQISKENWAYQYFDASFIDVNLGSATTFPQWGVTEAGGNANLVSEKSFEWHAGPFLAAAVYSFLFSIVFIILAARFRSRERSNLPEERRSWSAA